MQEYAYYVNKLRQNVGLEAEIWRRIVTSQTAHTKCKWPPYTNEWKLSSMKIFCVRRCHVHKETKDALFMTFIIVFLTTLKRILLTGLNTSSQTHRGSIFTAIVIPADRHLIGLGVLRSDGDSRFRLDLEKSQNLLWWALVSKNQTSVVSNFVQDVVIFLRKQYYNGPESWKFRSSLCFFSISPDLLRKVFGFSGSGLE